MTDVTNKKLQARLYALLKRKDLTEKLNENSLKDIVKYLLPKLLEGPIYHLKYCFNIMDVSWQAPGPCQNSPASTLKV